MPSFLLGRKSRNGIRPILVKFMDEYQRDEFYSARKLFLKQKIFVSEDLTRKRIELFKYAKEKFHRNVWTVDGNIKVRTDKGIITIRDKHDVDCIV